MERIENLKTELSTAIDEYDDTFESTRQLIQSSHNLLATLEIDRSEMVIMDLENDKPAESINNLVFDAFANTDDTLTLILDDRESKSGNPMVAVYAKHIQSNRTIGLFGIAYRINNSSDVVISVEGDFFSITTTIPALKDKLDEVFRLDTIKDKIANLRKVGLWTSA
jgi:hypothetical protein